MHTLEKVLQCFCRSPEESDLPAMNTVEYERGHELAQLEAAFPNFAQSIRGKRVLDLGCGHGYQSVALAKAGARVVVGVDIDPYQIRKARERHGDVPGVSFLESMPDDHNFDVILSQNSFEHFVEAEAVMQLMTGALAPGGQIFITFGPPWYAPWGAHMGFFCKIPWVHLVFPERVVLGVRSHYRPTNTDRYEGLGLAKMSLGKFQHVVSRSGMRPHYLRYDCVRRMNWLQHTPFKELFVNQVNCILQAA